MEKLNCLYHKSDYEISEETQEKVFDFLKNLGYQVKSIELHNVSQLYWNDEVDDMNGWSWDELKIYTSEVIDVDDACKLWSEDILDVEGSLTCVDSDGNLIWRES